MHLWCTGDHFVSMVDKLVLKAFEVKHYKSFECHSSVEKCPTQDQTKSVFTSGSLLRH
jgi:hypothetical protein